MIKQFSKKKNKDIYAEMMKGELDMDRLCTIATPSSSDELRHPAAEASCS